METKLVYAIERTIGKVLPVLIIHDKEISVVSSGWTSAATALVARHKQSATCTNTSAYHAFNLIIYNTDIQLLSAQSPKITQ